MTPRGNAPRGAGPPVSLGFRMPAEWEPHEATWIGWPHNRSDWPGKFSLIPWVFGEIVRRIAPGEIVRILVGSESHESRARNVLARAGVDASGFRFHRFPTNRGWTRDFGPIFVTRDRPAPRKAILGFGFNGWAKYDDWKLDRRVPGRAARALKIPLLPAESGGSQVVLEGGSIDVNGKGTLLTTEECLLDQTIQPRNPGMTRPAWERVLRDHLGVRNVLWLGRGIAGDDTHGHVDDLARFVSARTAVLCREANSKDDNYSALEENRERFESFRLEDGSRIDVVDLPMPAPLRFSGRRLPASYANFYVSNRAVLVPTFNDPNDRLALGILAELFPDRVVVGIHAVDLVWGLGTIHCLTQQEPA